MAEKRSLGRSVLSVTGARVLGLLFTFMQVKIAVTYLGARDYGLLTTVTVFIASFGAWTELGIGTIVVRRVSGRGNDLEHEVGLSMAISLLIMAPLVVGATVSGYVVYENPQVRAGIAILAIGLAATTWATCFYPVAQVKERFGHYAMADLSGRILSFVVILGVVGAHAGLFWFFVAQLIAPLCQFAAMQRLGSTSGRFRPVWNWVQIKDLAAETLPVAYILVVGVLYFTIDGVLLSMLAPEEEVGAYGLAYKTVGNVTILSSSLSAVMTSRFAAAAAEGPGSLAQTLRQPMRLLLFAALPVAFFSWPLAPDLIRLVGSEEMVILAQRPFALISIAIAIGMISGLVSTAMLAGHQQRFLTRLNTVCLVVNIALNLALIPKMQATGAAIALVTSEALGLVVCLVVLTQRYRGYMPFDTVRRLLPVILLSYLVEYLLRGQPWGLRLALVVLAFTVASLAVRAISLGEVKRLLSRGGTAS